MPRKSTRRLTFPKSQKSQKRTKNAYGTPSPGLWATMTKHRGFQVLDEKDEMYQFVQGNVALVLPEGVPPVNKLAVHEFWVCKIIEVRSIEDNEEPEVWARVQWYWSPQEIAERIESFDIARCGRFERLFSDQFDLVSSLCFSCIAPLAEYDETRLDQPTISPDTFYCRYNFKLRPRRISPNHEGTCLCTRAYNPDIDTMHFCPRPSCRASYHRECLLKAKWVETSTSGRDLRLLCSNPDSDDTFEMRTLGPRRKRVKLDLVAGSTYAPSGDRSLEEALDYLPTGLVKIAQLPIMKGVEGGGLVGNVRSVVAARRMVYEALMSVSGPLAVPSNWEERVDLSEVPSSRRAKQLSKIPLFRCPQCQGAI
ncbi:hypothetical protein JAAARDRAFT_158053 [Jaapia argillacea MUCL 33604]|uniref:BAH domain-containing protein n=1 Tax=Jaapia argillacea MUCL 33604 TaxID=933084 RepID=A0A067PZY1_9AGAM|nr:hypothetical protein JAAARDRAFT_158053 [Jaapia argillacea MUCL 33604]